MSPELEKIIELLQSYQAVNIELALTLIEAGHVPDWHHELDYFLDLLERCHHNITESYDNGGLDANEFTLLLTKFCITQYSQLPHPEKRASIIKFIGSTFSNDYKLNDHLEDWQQTKIQLEELLNPHNQLIYQLCTDSITKYDQLLSAFKQLSYEVWLEHNWLAWAYFIENFKRYNCQSESIWLSICQPLFELIEELSAYQHPAFKEISFQLLAQVWKNSSRHHFVHQLQAVFGLIQQLDFSATQIQKILLQSHLFQNEPQTQPSHNNSYHIYDGANDIYDSNIDKLQKIVQQLHPYFNQFELDQMDEEDQLFFVEKIHKLWSYYYANELFPYLQMIQEWDKAEATTHFYLGQYYQFRKNKDKAVHHYTQYICLKPACLPDNAFFISDSVWEHRVYTPSTLEALTRLGQLYEVAGDLEMAIHYYQKTLDLAPNHHQAAYWEFIRLALEDERWDQQLLHHAQNYAEIFFEETSWAILTLHNLVAITRSDSRRRYEQLQLPFLVPENNKGKHSFGYPAVREVLLGILHYFCKRHFENGELEQAWQLFLQVKKIWEQDRIRKVKDKLYIDYPFEVELVFEEDLLYLQAQLVEQYNQDYWQAKNLYRKVLKLAPNYLPAQKALTRLKTQLKY